MKKINKKGFTLVELLGVIVILILILSLVLPKIIGRTKSKDDVVVTLKDDIVIKAAKLYLEESVKPENDNTYCVDINNLVEKEYLLYDENYEGKKVKADYTNDGYSYSIDSSCTASSSSDERCESEGLCTACYVSKTYNNGVYLYEPKILSGFDITQLNISYVEDIDSCTLQTIYSAAQDYVKSHSGIFKKRLSDATYCLTITNLVNDGYLIEGLTTNGQSINTKKIKVQWSAANRQYAYELVDSNSCEEVIPPSMCIADKVPTNYSKSYCNPNGGSSYIAPVGIVPTKKSNGDVNFVQGSKWLCNVDNEYSSSGTYFYGEKRFFVYKEEDDIIWLYMEPHRGTSEIDYSGYSVMTNFAGNSRYWISSSDLSAARRNAGYNESKTSFGPITLLDAVYNNTKTWNTLNVNYDFTDTGGRYGGIKTVDDVTTLYDVRGNVVKTYKDMKAKILSMQDNTFICNANGSDCPKWFYYVLEGYSKTYAYRDTTCSAYDGRTGYSHLWYLNSSDTNPDRAQCLAVYTSDDYFRVVGRDVTSNTSYLRILVAIPKTEFNCDGCSISN